MPQYLNLGSLRIAAKHLSNLRQLGRRSRTFGKCFIDFEIENFTMIAQVFFFPLEDLEARFLLP